MLESLHEVPALLRNRHLDVLASNELARRVSAAFQPGVNMARFIFLNPEVAASTGDWDHVCRQSANCLRTSLETHLEDAGFRALVGELAARSDDFSRAWAQEPGDRVDTGNFDVEHPVVGSLSMAYQQLQGLHGPGDPVLVVLRARDRASRDALRRLRAM